MLRMPCYALRRLNGLSIKQAKRLWAAMAPAMAWLQISRQSIRHAVRWIFASVRRHLRNPLLITFCHIEHAARSCL